MKWDRKRVLVTGGVGFIGSHLVKALLSKGTTLTVVDKPRVSRKESLWEKKLAHYLNLWERTGYELSYTYYPRYTVESNGHVVLQLVDLETEKEFLLNLMRKREIDIVFHLAAVFGGRGFVDTYQADCCVNFAINHNVISAAYQAGVKHLHFASSACVYPPSLNKPRYLLKEDDILKTGDGWLSSDNTYGFAKLMGELELKSYHEQYGLEGSVARYLTVYGPGEFDESHAIAAFIGRALRKEDPFIVWGTGEQERGFTYVEDIVEGTIKAAEIIKDASPVNLGWEKRYKIKEVVDIVLSVAGYSPRVLFDLDKPTGPYSRALDITRARTLLGWEPKIDLPEGIKRTYEWARENIKIPQSATEKGRS